MSMPRRVSEDELGPRRRANSPSRKAGSMGAGYGVPNPMSNRRAARAVVTARCVQLDLFGEVGGGCDTAPLTQAERGRGAGRSPA